MPSPPSTPRQTVQETLSSQYLRNRRLAPDFLEKYALGQELGSGGFGFVLSAYERYTGIERAVKFIFRDKVPASAWIRDRQMGPIPMEIYVLKHVRHPNMIQYIDSYQDDSFFYLVMELHGSEWAPTTNTNMNNISSIANPMMTPPTTPPASFAHSPTFSHHSDDSSILSFDSAGVAGYQPDAIFGRRSSCDLFECIEQHQNFDEPLAKNIFRQIASCVAQLDKLGICHRDIKDENIVIDRNYQVKLIDFGSAVILPRHYGDNRPCLFTKFYGTVSFASPEILQCQPYLAEPAEVWSLGVLLYTILFGEVPFHGPHMTLTGRFAQPKINVSEKCMHLVKSMLEISPAKRPSIHQILTHPWLADF
ncbi:kinase-like domain-containing protein [Phycomyces blakesleeanus]|uniref:Kinase-like domain-containing protein n=1 Tax=Phycomyces blakesleeanus TaxID=4837 RepID=A0ABR3AP35_PHYBL